MSYYERTLSSESDVLRVTTEITIQWAEISSSITTDKVYDIIMTLDRDQADVEFTCNVIRGLLESLASEFEDANDMEVVLGEFMKAGRDAWLEQKIKSDNS